MLESKAHPSPLRSVVIKSSECRVQSSNDVCAKRDYLIVIPAYAGMTILFIMYSGPPVVPFAGEGVARSAGVVVDMSLRGNGCRPTRG